MAGWRLKERVVKGNFEMWESRLVRKVPVGICSHEFRVKPGSLFGWFPPRLQFGEKGTGTIQR